MKKKPIEYRSKNMQTSYYPSGRMTKVSAGSSFPSLLQRVEEEAIQDQFRLAAVTADFVYYVDDQESDETVSVVMVTKDLKLVSDNVFATNDLTALVESNDGLLWMSTTVKLWQREQFVKRGLITGKIKHILEEVNIEKLTKEEKVIYYAFLNNGPVNYSKPESLMAVLSNDLNQINISSQLAAIKEMLPNNIK